jgi:hypothetical protein
MSGMNMSPSAGQTTHSWLTLGHVGLIVSILIALFYGFLLLRRNQVASVCDCKTDTCDCYVAHCDCYSKSFHGLMAIGMAFMFATLTIVPWIYGSILFIGMGLFFAIRIIMPKFRPHYFKLKYDVVHFILAFSMAFMFSPLISYKSWRLLSGIFLATFIVFSIFYVWQSLSAFNSQLGNSIKRLEVGTHLAHVAMVVLMGFMIVVSI